MEPCGEAKFGSQPDPPSSYEAENCLLLSAAPAESIESAVRHIRAGAAAIRASSPKRSVYSAEFEALVDYAQSNELMLLEGSVPKNYLDHGQEHVVWHSACAKRVLKATYPNKFGLTIGEDPDASPLQYFERMELTNQIFGDDIRFEGLCPVGGKIQVVISQPMIVGGLVEAQDIVDVMLELGFQGAELDGQPCWYLEELHVLAFDAHTRNFVDTDAGPIPIDVNLILLDKEVSAQTLLAFEESET